MHVAEQGYSRLDDQDGFYLKTRLDMGDSLRSMAADLGRAPSTMAREAKRNGLGGGGYCDREAGRRARRRRTARTVGTAAQHQRRELRPANHASQSTPLVETLDQRLSRRVEQTLGYKGRNGAGKGTWWCSTREGRQRVPRLRRIARLGGQAFPAGENPQRTESDSWGVRCCPCASAASPKSSSRHGGLGPARSASCWP